MASRILEEPLEHEIDPQLQQELATHAGRWVATTRSELLAVGDSAAEVYEAARAQGVEVPIVFRVRGDETTIYFY